MGLYDREYTQYHYQPSHGRYTRLPRLGGHSMVVRLIVINSAVYLLSIIFRPVGALVYHWGQLDGSSLLTGLQLWRLVTYQFLHDPTSIWHILFNMFVLYMFGRILEPYLGPRKFLLFYLACGAVGGVFYLLLIAVGFLPALPMVGASGSIYGILGACAVLFPQIKMIIFPIFIPISIRTAAIAGVVIFLVLTFTRTANAGGQAAHLAGLATGALYAAWPAIRTRLRLKPGAGRWQKKIDNQQELSEQVDRILEKVYNQGISSLTRKEKSILKKATQLHQQSKK